MSEQKYRTLHAPAAAEDLMDGNERQYAPAAMEESERRYRRLLERMSALERETKLQAQRSEQKIDELNRRNQELEARNKQNEQQSARKIAELERRIREVTEQNKQLHQQSPQDRSDQPDGKGDVSRGQRSGRSIRVELDKVVIVCLLIIVIGLVFWRVTRQSNETVQTAATSPVADMEETVTVSEEYETAAEETEIVVDEFEEDISEAAEAAAAYVDGTYTSAGYQGMESEIVATVTIEDGVITAIDADFSGETESLGGVAGPRMVEKILEAQSADVDTVSGATVTSMAVIDAVNDCLAQAEP